MFQYYFAQKVTDPVKPGKKKKKIEEKTDGEETDKGGKKGEKEGSKEKESDDKKKKRKIRLDMHLDQVKTILFYSFYLIYHILLCFSLKIVHSEQNQSLMFRGIRVLWQT